MSQGRRGSHSIGTHSNADWDPTGPEAPRDLLHDRYAVGRVIGRGAFARVVVAYDIVTDARVAIKITRKASRSFHQRARKEIEILRVLGGGGGARAAGESETSVGHPNVVTLLDHFAHRGESDALFGPEESFSSSSAAESGDPANATRKTENPNDPEEKDRSEARADTNDAGLRCLVFELLSHSLYDVLRATSFRGVSLALVRKFSFQILHALSYLKSHGVVHLDLKPENVLLCSTDRSRVKLVDFGSSRWVTEKEETNLYAQSRFYRAAEVLLGLPCGCPADVWSLGCIMVELHGGKPLFPGRDERHQLCKIAETLGPVPEDMFAKASAERRKTHAHAAARRETDDGTLADADGPSADVRKQFATLGFVPKPHGSRPLRTVIAAASSAFEARQRERQSSSARGDDKLVDDKRADAAATSMRALGLERDGEDFQSSRDFSRDDAFADAAETFSAEEARLTSVALFCDVVERFLTYAPELRAQPGTALEHPFFSADGAARGGFEALFFRGETMGETSFDEPFAGVDDEMLMYGLEGTDA
jgi:dual specificity tyrosine-phosphorylation-regulated kinase 1